MACTTSHVCPRANRLRDLVDTVARFDPRLVMNAPAGEQPED